VVTARSRLGAGDVVAPSDKLQNHEDAEIDVSAFKNCLEKQEKDVEFVFLDDDAKGDGTDDESEKTVTPPPMQDSDSDGTCSDDPDVNPKQQDGPAGQGRK
jgi:hypothetical protein